MQRLPLFLSRVRRASPGGRSIPRYCRFASSLNFAFFDFVETHFRCEEPPFLRCYTWPKTLELSIFILSVGPTFLRTLPGWTEIRNRWELPYLRISVCKLDRPANHPEKRFLRCISEESRTPLRRSLCPLPIPDQHYWGQGSPVVYKAPSRRRPTLGIASGVG